MKTTSRQEYLDWSIILIILLIGFLCLIASGWMALRFSPSWELNADMGSNLDPNSEFLTRRPHGFIEPVDAAILTAPTWIASFLTPGITVPTNPPLLVTVTTTTPRVTNTTAPGTVAASITPTSAASTPTSTITVIFIPPTRTPTSNVVAPTRTPTVSRTPTVTSTATNTVTATATATNTNLPSVDLQITKDDGVTTYTPGSTLTYQIVVSNNSAVQVNGASVTDSFSTQLANVSWTCTPDSGASCTPNGTGDISDSVNLPAGLSVTYTITADISPYSAGDLINTATVMAPSGYVESAPGNNSATDINTCTTPEPNIGPPDSAWINITSGTAITMLLDPAIVADGDIGTPDLVYYERLATPTRVDMDWVQVEISSDGITWYQVLYWGDPAGLPDTNTNIDVQNQIGDLCATETDNCNIPTTRLYNNTGVTIDIDALVPSGSYPWIRITSPASGGDPSELDAIQPYYP